MNALVIYGSEYGNTERIARAIAKGLGGRYAVRVAPVSEAVQPMPEVLDLLVVGGPTQKHGMSPNLREFLDRLPRKGLRRVRAATFDTRYRMSRLLSGSAARQAAGRLRRGAAGSSRHRRASLWSATCRRGARSAATAWSNWNRAR